MPIIPAVNYLRSMASTALITLMAVGALSAQTVKSDFRVNDDGASVEHSQPRVAVIPGRGFAVVWSDYRTGDRSIYIQRFTLLGDAVGGNQLVNTDTLAVYQAGPAVGIDGAGHYEIVWQDYRDGAYPFGPHVYFQRYDSSLTPLGTNRNLTVERPDSLKEYPDIDVDSWGRGVVVWADYRNHNWDIYGQLIAPNGALVGSNFKINDDNTSAQQHSPRVSMSSDGWFVVVWYDNRQGSDDIFGQRFDTLGHPLGANFRVNSDVGTARQAFPDVATDGNGHFTVVWVDWRNGTYPYNPDIFARKFDTLLNPMTVDTRINSDGASLAQRDPAVSADRNGNVAIVWSDSSSTSWDVTGQMIDAAGVVRERNFRANSKVDSAQLQPDVALDGHNRYITWVDKRNGRFDIYASVVTYNTPTLVASPTQIHLTADVSDPVLPSQSLVISHAGYNKISFRAKSSAAWLGVTPGNGQTVDTLSVALTQTLPYGTYFATVNLVDDDNHDSTLTVPVRVDITAPLLRVTPDTVRVSAFSELQDTVHAELTIQNGGSGSIIWSAGSTVPWMQLSSSSGVAPSTIDLSLVTSGLDTGIYSGALVVTAPGIAGSPDTVPVLFEVVSNRPFLSVTPDSVWIATADTSAVSVPSLVVTNSGVGSINWTASPSEAWIRLDRASGMAGDSIHLSIDWAALLPGRSTGSVRVVDSNSFNVAVNIPVTVDLLNQSADTVELGTAMALTADTTSISISVNLQQSAREITLPLHFPDTLVQFDSLSLAAPLRASFTTLTSPTSLGAEIRILANSTDSLGSGTTTVGRLYFTTQSREGVASVEEDLGGTQRAQVVTTTGQRNRPAVIPGLITVGARTGVRDNDPSSLPRSLSLSQNYPNPFNGSTVIQFGLPHAGAVRLELFNVLGQSVAVLLDKTLPAGWHQTNWAGQYPDGTMVPTGIYFYRLETAGGFQVRKLIVLK